MSHSAVASAVWSNWIVLNRILFVGCVVLAEQEQSQMSHLTGDLSVGPALKVFASNSDNFHWI